MARQQPRISVGELAAAVAALPELPAVERARVAAGLLAVARQVLQGEQAAGLAEARDAGWSETRLGHELGIPAAEVAGLLAEHARTEAARRPAAAGQRPVNRSRAAQRLARRLSDAAEVPVEIRWDSSGASSQRRGGWAYHVEWFDGPTRARMRQLVDQVAEQDPGLDPDELVFVRVVKPAAVALAMVGNVAAGQPALGGHQHADELQQALDDVEHPELGTEQQLQLAARLGRLTNWNIDRMAALLDAHGLAALTGELAPDPAGTVVPLARPTGPGR